MRVALVSPSFLPTTGGAEFVVHNLAMEWGCQGHEVRVFNWLTDEAAHADATYAVSRFRVLRGAPRVGYHRFPWGWYTRRDLAAQLRDYAPDCISAHMGYPTGYYLDGLVPDCPRVITCHGGDLTLFGWGFRQRYDIDAILRDALEHSSGAIAISSFARKLMEELGVSSEKIFDIPNGVDLERFRRPVAFDLRDHFALGSEKRVLLSVGREHDQKAYATGLRAFARVAQVRPEAHYLLVGKGNGVHAQLCEELGIGDRVTLCEGLYGEDLVGAYQQADIFFSSSIWEMMPLVVLEAMAAGRPAVVTNISGSQDLIRSGENGLVVEPGDEEAMAQALLSLLADDDLMNSFSQATLSAAKGYSWDRVSRLYLELAMGSQG
ncbi:MAG: glycosyltransferase family 4 protein [Myxococcota bacterium]|nr:glycosyltransferase family 4 protein [Myxococcota bacterium]